MASCREPTNETKARPTPTDKQIADAKAAALIALTPKKGDAPTKVDVVVFQDGESFIAIAQTKLAASEKGSCTDKGAVVVLAEKTQGVWKPFFRPQPKQKNVCGYSFFTHGDVDGCQASCNQCSGTCVAGCTQCKAACRDDGCRRTCAESCASCKQACLRDVDRCTSGGCPEDGLGAKYRTCRAALRDTWLATEVGSALRRWGRGGVDEQVEPRSGYSVDPPTDATTVHPTFGLRSPIVAGPPVSAP